MQNDTKQYVTMEQYQRLVEKFEKLESALVDTDKQIAGINKLNTQTQRNLRNLSALCEKLKSKVVFLSSTVSALSNSVSSAIRGLRDNRE